MTQNDLNRAVARATGETIRTVTHRGFGIADPDIVGFDPEPNDIESKTVDWDALDAGRPGVCPQRRRREPAPA